MMEDMDVYKVKKNFLIGFIVGVVYFFATYLLLEVVMSGCPWDLGEGMCGIFISMFNFPSFLILSIFDNILPSAVKIEEIIIVPLVNGILFGSLLSGYLYLVRKL